MNYRVKVIDKYQMSNMLLRDKLEFPFTRIKQIFSEPDMHLFDGYMFFTIQKRRSEGTGAAPRGKKVKDEPSPTPSPCIGPPACNGAGNEVIKDPFCDPDNPKKVTFQDVSAAAYKIKDGIHHSPCIVSW